MHTVLFPFQGCFTNLQTYNMCHSFVIVPIGSRSYCLLPSNIEALNLNPMSTLGYMFSKGWCPRHCCTSSNINPASVCGFIVADLLNPSLSTTSLEFQSRPRAPLGHNILIYHLTTRHPVARSAILRQ